MREMNASMTHYHSPKGATTRCTNAEVYVHAPLSVDVISSSNTNVASIEGSMVLSALHVALFNTTIFDIFGAVSAKGVETRYTNGGACPCFTSFALGYPLKCSWNQPSLPYE